MSFLKKNGHVIGLAAIMLLAAALNMYHLANEGMANTYYAAGVKSMLESWHNFFFNSYDPGGFITIDKPPLGFWIQTLSAKIFGFHGSSLILPQAVAGMLSVGLLYVLVRKCFGRAAGLIAALVLAVTPIAVAAARNNTIDNLLVLCMLIAAWMLSRAVEQGKLRYLLLSAAVAGLGYNIKMMEAFMALPAFYLIYLLAPKLKWKQKLKHLGAATVILAVVSLSWTVIVDSIPKDQRPYIGSTKTNSVMELALQHNALERLEGKRGQGGETRAAGQRTGTQTSSDKSNDGHSNQRAADSSLQAAKSVRDSAFHSGMQPSQGMSSFSVMRFPQGFSGRGGDFGGETGQAGFLRMFNQSLSGQVSWLLPFAAFGAAALLWRIRLLKPPAWTTKQRMALFWIAWLVPMLVFFSFAGFFHRYYLVMLAPAVGALTGSGAVKMWCDFRAKTISGWLLPLAILSTAAVEVVLVWRYPALRGILAAIIGIFTIVTLLVLAGLRLKPRLADSGWLRTAAVTTGLVALLTAPAYWAFTPTIYGNSGSMPFAGPELKNSNGMMQRQSTNNGHLTQYLTSHYTEGTYLVATPSAQTSSPLILDTGLPVLTWGGFSGSDPAITAAQMEQMAREGKIKYFLISGMSFGSFGGRSSAGSGITDWIKQHCRAVPSEEWQGGAFAQSSDVSKMSRSATLYEYQEQS